MTTPSKPEASPSEARHVEVMACGPVGYVKAEAFEHLRSGRSAGVMLWAPEDGADTAGYVAVYPAPPSPAKEG